MDKLVIASKNKGKIKEIQSILSEFEVISMFDVGIDEDIEENGNSFEENSLIKARRVHDLCGYSVLADDSGLEVASLDNRPGIFSARYSEIGSVYLSDKNISMDERNNLKLLKEMENIDDRRARFVCALTFISRCGEVISTFGSTEGEILRKRTGNNGFGYDCIFHSYELNKSFGEATDEEKNTVSHRFKALINLKHILKSN